MELVLFHDYCADGFTSAYIWRQKAKPNSTFKLVKDTNEFIQITRCEHYDTVYIPVNYNDVLPEFYPSDDVVLLDFSYPNTVMLNIQEKCNSLLVIDHHKTADLTNIKNQLFDINESGASLTLKYVELEDESLLKLTSYVKDRDLWTFKLPYSKEINAYIQLKDKTFQDYAVLEDELYTEDYFVIRCGTNLLKYKNNIIEELAKNRTIEHIALNNEPIAQCTYVENNVGSLTSELGDYILNNSDIPIVAIKTSDTKYSLRSKPDVDVTEIAKLFGGGGHKNAAGCYNLTFYKEEEQEC